MAGNTVSRGIYSKVPKEGDIWTDTQGTGSGVKTTGRAEGEPYRRGAPDGNSQTKAPGFAGGYIAVQHLKNVFNTAYGEHTTQADAQFRKYRYILCDEHEGIEKVIRALLHLHNKHPRRKKLKTELSYFRCHRARMRYAVAKEQHLPIGSGVVEAVCKTLSCS